MREIRIGDILKLRGMYLKVAYIANTGSRLEYWGDWKRDYFSAKNEPGKRVLYVRERDPYELVYTSDGTVVPEIEKIQKLSRREQIIYIANKYKQKILKEDFLNEHGFRTIGLELGIGNTGLYRYLAFKLRINQLSNKINEWKYRVWDCEPEEKKSKKQKARKKVVEKEAIFSVVDVWKLLAYYCAHYSVADAKNALARFEKLFHKKDWDRIKEMWTPLFYPDYNYALSKLIVCKIIKKRKENVYDAELLPDGMNLEALNENQYLNKKCIVVAQDKDKERIEYLLNNGSEVKIVGKKEKPYRNKTSSILKITTVRKR